MWISKGRRGLLALAAALAVGTVNGDRVIFTDGFTVNGGNRAILFFAQISHGWPFSWSSGNTVVEEITLFTFSLSSGVVVPNSERQVGYAKLPEPGSEGTPGGSQGAELNITSNEQGGNVVFMSTAGIGAGTPLFFEAKWDNGRSYSRPFTLISDAADIQNTAQFYASAEPYKPEFVDPIGSPADDSQVPGNIGGETPNTTQQSGETPNTTPQSTTAGGGQIVGPTVTPTAKNASAGNGLPQGAIIGIAVGCGVAGLLIVFGLAWYLLRRHRKKKAMLPVGSAYGSGNRADELMAEKEASADVDVAPHSPYSDDGAPAPAGGGGGGGGSTYEDGSAHGEPVAAGAVAAAHSRQHLQNPPRSFTPYTDRPSASGSAAGTPSVPGAAPVALADDARVSVPSPIPGRGTPRALATPYAHLVEEGMTEDEIRRLEEEERQLDAAIEQAGRR